MKDIQSMTFQELQDHKAEVDKLFESKKAQEIERVLESTKSLFKNLGMEVELKAVPLPTVQGKVAKPKPVFKYQHPTDPTKAWSGRGRQPSWLAELLAEGKNLEDLAIKQ